MSPNPPNFPPQLPNRMTWGYPGQRIREVPAGLAHGCDPITPARGWLVQGLLEPFPAHPGLCSRAVGATQHQPKT